MNFLPPFKPLQFKAPETKKGIMLLTAVIVLAGIILILIVSIYLSTNFIRWQSFALPKSTQALFNAESCFAFLLAKLKVSPAYTTQNSWKTFSQNDIQCQYLIEDTENSKLVKILNTSSGYYKKFIIHLQEVTP